MELTVIEQDFSICKVEDYSLVDLDREFTFIGKTDNENSLVCITKDVPPNTTQRDDGWKAFRICGTMDFSLIGILSSISGTLAKNGIGIFAISTFDTDYILIKTDDFQRAMDALIDAGHTFSK